MNSCSVRRIVVVSCAVALVSLAGAGRAATNLLANPGFDSDLSGWINAYDRTASWDPLDAAGIAGSGSARVGNDLAPSNGATPLVLTQCVAVTAYTAYVYGALMMVPAGQPQDTYAEIFVETFASGDCNGDATLLEAQQTASVGAWDVRNGSFTAGPGIHSVLLGLGVYKPTGVSASAVGSFDNVYLREDGSGTGFAIGPFISASWYNPAESGHGIMLDLLEGGRAWMCWFTFTLDGHPAWICALGSFSGNVIEFPAAFTVSGGRFPPMFDPALVASVPWGSITITFTDCEHGTMTWTTAAAGFQSGSMPLARVTTLWGYACPS